MEATDPNNQLASYLMLDDKDEDLSNWKRMIELEKPESSELDWYSTRTFEIFLDALDIGHPTTNPVSKSTTNASTSSPVNKSSLSENAPADKDRVTSILSTVTAEDGSKKSDVDTSGGTDKRLHAAETILSAEALKILSELPDLTHMSSTRSFIFPNSARAKK